MAVDPHRLTPRANPRASRPTRRAAFRPTLERLERREVLNGTPLYTLQVLHAGDLEAGLAAVGDAPRFAAVVDALDGTHANTLILSSGDNYLSGPFFNASGDPALEPALGGPGTASIGRGDIEVMNRIGFDASVLGNHEFDLGPRELRNLFFPAGAYRGGQFPYLSANANFSGEPDLASRATTANGLEANALKGRFAPSAVITRGGERIGVIGLTTPETRFISSPGGVTFAPLDPDDLAGLAQIANDTVDALESQGVNKVILLTQLQQFQNDLNLAPLLRGVDVILSGGSNTISADATDRLRVNDTAESAYPVIRTSAESLPVAVVSTDGNYRYVGRLVVQFDAAGVLVANAGAYTDPAVSGAYATDAQGVTDVYAALGLDPATALTAGKGAAVKQVTDLIDGVIRVKDGSLFGQTDVFLEGRRVPIRTQETNLGNLTADANLAAARQLTGDATIGISLKNGGGIRDSIGSVGPNGELLPPAANPSVGKAAGDVSQLDIENSLRFNNGLSVVSLNGAELRRLLEFGFAASAPGLTQGRFPQIGGMAVEVDFTKPANSRLITLTATDVSGAQVTVVRNGTTVVPDARFRMVTLGFLAGGGDGYPFGTLSNPARVDLAPTTGNAFITPGSEQKALADYFAANFPVGGTAAFNQADTPAGDDRRIRQVIAPNDDLTLSPISTTSVPGGAEISAYDPASKKLFVTKNNAGVPSLDVLDLTDPASPVVVANINLSAYGASISSVAVKDGIVVAALIAGPKTDPGRAVFLDAAGSVLGSVTVGAVPDMVTFTPDGSKVLVAIEGEAADNTFPTVNNPEGGVSIITLDRGNLGNSAVTFAGFAAFNGQKAALRAAGVRLLPDANVTVAMDVEAEYIAVAADGRTARVTLQEANAFGVLDLTTGTFTSIQPLGLKDYSLPGNEFDASDRDGPGTGGSSRRQFPGNLKSWPVFGVYMPDAIASFQVGGQTYYVTANEGDARPNAADTADTDVTRVGSLNLDDALFPDEASLKNEDNLGRLNVLTGPGDGDTDGDGDIDRLLSLGGRSFTIWDAAGNKVYDSGSDLERRTFALTPTFFNANDGVASAVDQRSDDKGPEPEGVVTGAIGGRTYAFVGLERAGGGVMVYDVSAPAAPRFVTYARKDGDVSPEGLVFIAAADSPNGRPLLVVSNEVSGTVTVYEIGRQPVINEFVVDPNGADTAEYVEVLGAANADLSAYTVLVVEGDAGANVGQVTAALPLGTADAAGLFSTGLLDGVLNNGTNTILLVRGYTGAANVDLDTNNDGVLDATPWAALVDAVAVNDGGAGDRTYGTVVLGPAFAAGASRIPNGTDTNAPSDFVANNTDGNALTGEAANTPGAANRLIFAPTVLTFTTNSAALGGKAEGQRVTATGTFSDPDRAINSYAATVFWGDGTSSSATVDAAAGTFTATHVYADGGVYTARVVLTDSDGASDDAAAQAVIAGAGVRDGVLYVVGTNRNDVALIGRLFFGPVFVTANFLPGFGVKAFAASGVQRIVVLLGDGDDTAAVLGTVNAPAVMSGGAGRDRLIGGAFRRNILIGGAGSDELIGGLSGDLLIGGTTAFDVNAAALLSLLDEWNSGRSYADRVANLRGTGSGPRLNGSVFLKADETVLDDAAADELHGGPGQDWFFAALGGKKKDKVTGKGFGEVTDPLSR